MENKLLGLFILFFSIASVASGQTNDTRTDSLFLQEEKEKLETQNQSTQQNQLQKSALANPDISVIGDFRGYYHTYGNKKVRAYLNEAEFSFQSIIDPYARADFFYSASQDPATGEFTGEIEEGFVSTTSLPAHLQLKAGRFLQTLGRVNTIHAHAMQFINMPDANISFFGEEGLKGDGVSLIWLIPNRSFFQELTIEVTEPVEGGVFSRSNRNQFLYLFHLKNFWDLTSNTSLEFGLCGLSGVNYLQQTNKMAAIDITLKWKPLQYNTYHSFTFQNEFFYNSEKIFHDLENSFGFYSMLNYQVAQRWFVTGRYDFYEIQAQKSSHQYSFIATLSWFATEFQKIEVEGKYSFANHKFPVYNNEKKFYSAYLRWIFIIGSHGAHKY